MDRTSSSRGPSAASISWCAYWPIPVARPDTVTARRGDHERQRWRRDMCVAQCSHGSRACITTGASPHLMSEVPGGITPHWRATRDTRFALLRAAGDERPEADGGRSAGRRQMAGLQSCCAWSSRLFCPVHRQTPLRATRAPAHAAALRHYLWW